MSRGPTIVGISGPDGAGKSSLQRALADAAVARGVAVRTTYLYGCVACRNLRLPGRLAGAVSSPGAVGVGRSGRAGRSSLWQWMHALIDTAELALRLGLARRGRRYSVLLTDRSPLDAVVKHDPPAAGLTARWLRALAGHYAAIVLLDAPADVLSARDGEHAAAGLESARESYRRWSARLPGVRIRSTEATGSDELARAVLDEVLDHAAVPAGQRPAGDSSA